MEEQSLPRRTFFLVEFADEVEFAGGIVFTAELLVGLGEVEMSLDEVGPEASGLFEFDDGLGRPVPLEQPFAEEGVGGGEFGTQFDRPAGIGVDAGEVQAFFGGCGEVPGPIVGGGFLEEALGEAAGIGETAALDENRGEGIEGEGAGKAACELRLSLVPALQFLEGQAAAETDEGGLGEKGLGIGEDVESGVGSVAAEEDAAELDVGGLVAGFQLEGGFDGGDGGGGVVAAVSDFGGKYVPAGGIRRQAGQLGMRGGIVAEGDEAFDRRPICDCQQKQHPHRRYFIMATVSRICGILAMAGISALAAPEYAGPAACQGCHASQFTTQSVSQHARALRPIAGTDIPERLAGQPMRERSGVRFDYARAAGGLAVTITKGAERTEALLEWAFGSGSQAVTPVGRYKGAYFEHRISYYRGPDQAARTIGHSGTPSASAEAALGMRQDAATITRCFTCHATNVREGPELSAMIPGVTCERCHGPGSEHARRPGEARMKRTAAVALCAECHRMPETTDGAIVRFQLAGLSASACFRASGRLTCVSCHNPHQDAGRTAGPYVAVCAGCHTVPARAGAACERNRKQNCLPCHMGKSTPLPHLTFTDHRIRVYGRTR